MTQTDVKDEIREVLRMIEITEKKMSFTNEPKLIDALSFELLSLRARAGYLIDIAKQCI